MSCSKATGKFVMGQKWDWKWDYEWREMEFGLDFGLAAGWPPGRLWEDFG